MDKKEFERFMEIIESKNKKLEELEKEMAEIKAEMEKMELYIAYQEDKLNSFLKS